MAAMRDAAPRSAGLAPGPRGEERRSGQDGMGEEPVQAAREDVRKLVDAVRRARPAPEVEPAFVFRA